MSEKVFQNTGMLSALQNANSILLCSHVSPDGDTIGSMLCMNLVLKKMGKDVTPGCPDKIPEKFRMLKYAEQIQSPEQLEGRNFDLVFAIDAGDLQRIGGLAKFFENAPVTVQIDHHGTNPAYAQYNEIDADAAATACMIYRFIKATGVELDKDMAECLYSGVSTDTGNFSFNSTDEEVFDMMSALVRVKNFDLSKMARILHRVRETKHVQLLGRALNTLHFFCDGQATGMKLDKQYFDMYQATNEHSDMIVNYGLDLYDVLMTYFAYEFVPGKIRVSIRSAEPYDASKIAVQFGGGGHRAAAGCTIENKPIDDACMLIENAIQEQLKETIG